MARIRYYNPEVWTSEQLVGCSMGARLLWFGLQTFADDAGAVPAKAMTLKMQIFPGDPLTVADVNEMIEELETQGLIMPYTAAQDGQRYLQVQGWAKLQKIDKPSIKYPRPDAVNIKEKNINTEGQKQAGNHTFSEKNGYELPSSSGVVAEHSANGSRTLGEHSASATPRSRVEKSRVEGKGGECESAHTPAHEAESSPMEVLPSGSDAGSPPEWGAAPPSWMEVSTQMIDFFKKTDAGRSQWAYMEGTAGGGAVSIDAVCAAWAGKASQHELLHWRENIGRLVPWVANEARKPTTHSRPAGPRKAAPGIEQIDSSKYEAYA